MNIHRTLSLSLSILALAACGEEAPPPAPETPPAVVEAPPPEAEPTPEPVAVGTVAPPSAEELAQATETGTLARSILRDATQADALLAAASLTPESFEARVFVIARSPALSDAYRVALEAP